MVFQSETQRIVPGAWGEFSSGNWSGTTAMTALGDFIYAAQGRSLWRIST